MDNRSLFDSYRENRVNIRHKKKIAMGLAAAACLAVFITGVVIAATAKGYPIPDDDTVIKHMVELANKAHCSIDNIKDKPGPAGYGHFRSFALECSGSETERLINNNRANKAINDYLDDVLEPGMAPMEIVGLVLSTGGWLAATCAGGFGALMALALLQFLLTMIKMAMPSIHESLSLGLNNVTNVISTMAANSYATTTGLISRLGGGYVHQVDEQTATAAHSTTTAASESSTPADHTITVSSEASEPSDGPTSTPTPSS